MEQHARGAGGNTNVLELEVVQLFLMHFAHGITGQHVLVHTDNTAMTAYNRTPRQHSLWTILGARGAGKN